MLWSYAGQCDWWISASDDLPLKSFVAGLLDLSNLRSTLWSNDDSGAQLLHDLRGAVALTARFRHGP
jgi:hypothetical protein